MVNQEPEKTAYSKQAGSEPPLRHSALSAPVRPAGLCVISSANVAPERGRRLSYNRGRPLTT